MALYTLPKILHPDFSEPGRKPVERSVIDWDNPITAGLKTYSAFNGSDIYEDLVQGQGDYGQSAGKTFPVINEGKSIYLDGTADAGLRYPVSVNVADGITIACRFQLRQDNGAGQGLISLGLSTGGSDWLRLTAQTNVAGNPLRLQASDSTSKLVMDLGEVTTGHHFAAARFINGIDGILTLDGEQSSSSDLSFASVTLDKVYLGAWWNGGYNQVMDGDMMWAACWNRALSDAELNSLRFDPYQILKPAIPLQFFVADAGTGFTLAVDAGTVALAGIDATLTVATDYTLAVDAGTVALAGIDATLTVATDYTLAVDAGTVALAGIDAALTPATAGAFTLTALVGDVALSGVDALFQRGIVLPVDAGTVALAGIDATLTSATDYALAVDPGAIGLTGLESDLLYYRSLTADAGAVALTGIAATLLSSLTPAYVNVLSADQTITQTINATGDLS